MKKKRRQKSMQRAGRLAAGAPFAAASLFGLLHAAAAQEATTDTGSLEEIIVTAEKRTENLQNVPVSITAIGNAQLEQLHVENFNDYMQLLPSASVQTLGPGNGRVFMRGIATGDYPNHSGSLPSVGTYLDEQPITTILGAVDVHVYDVERVEALSGPQGTLYGASSEAGTIRIITNKPDPAGFKAGYDLQLNTVYNGTVGGVAEGFVNLPVASNAAVRLVGWYEKDSGFIDNVPGTLTYPATANSPPFTIDNSAVAKKHYNDAETYGGRAALKVDLNDSWSITPAVLSQVTESNGIFAEELKQPGYTQLSAPIGEYQVSHFYPEPAYDDFTDASLTIQGKISNIDVVYAGSFMKRANISWADYTDYSLAYDVNYEGSGSIWKDTSGNAVQPSQYIESRYNYQMYSNELRFSTPAKEPLRFVGGVYQQRQQNLILQRYFINGSNGDGLSAGNGSAPYLGITGWPNTWWLTDQMRVNRDYAVFGDLSYDILPQLTASAGLRWFRYDNSLNGFYGFGINNPYGSPGSPVEGEGTCTLQQPFYGAPCQDATQPATSGNGTTPKFNLTWHVTDDKLVYATVSRGFRPGGANRVLIGGLNIPFKPDYLTNYEIGWKTSWFGNTLRFNGAIYQDDWKDLQYNFLGPYSVTIILNAAQARSQGLESQIDWVPVEGLTLSAGIALTHARLTSNYCGPKFIDANGNPITSCPSPQAPSGTALPTTPSFKGNLSARYTFPLMDSKAYVEGTVVNQDAVWPDLRLYERSLLGQQPGWTTFDFSFGVDRKSYTLELFAKNLFNERVELYRYAECTPGTCAQYASYAGVAPPRIIGIKFGQKF